MKKILTTICLTILIQILLAAPARAQAIENLEFFGAEVPPAIGTDTGRNMAACVAGLRTFLSAAVGYEDFKDYVRDFYIGFRWPMYYADIAGVENRVNRTRYAIVSSFLKCEINSMKALSAQYYKLEAELYFVRHFVDTSGGAPRNRAESPSDRQNFINQMTDYFILRKQSEDKEQDRALFSGYFDVFAAKYSNRSRMYIGFGEDPVWVALADKVDQLIETFKGFSKLGNELGSLATETGELGVAIKDRAVAIYNSPLTSLVGISVNASERLSFCPATGSSNECAQLINSVAAVFAPKKPGEKLTFDQVQQAIDSMDSAKVEQESMSAALIKYEVMYGQVNGDGVEALMGKMDKFLAILSTDRAADPASKDAERAEPVKGSLPVLEKVVRCAEAVQNNVCK